MKIKLNEKFVAEIFEVSELKVKPPPNFKEPYYIVAEAREDLTVDFEFQARRDVLRKNGKPQIHHRDLGKAQAYENYRHATATAHKMKSQEFNINRKYYVVGSEEAKIIQILNEVSNGKFKKDISEL
ncbi:MAG: hypothetical protein V7724_18380 [Sediminicola sp.]